MFAKAFLLAATLLFAARAHAQACDVEVSIDTLVANTASAGTTNAVATKDNLNILPGDLCGDYVGVGNGHASWTTCNGSTVVSVNPPDAGIAYCESSNIPPPEIMRYLFSSRYLLLLLLARAVSHKVPKN
ncbi:hypothetical protein K438DRAFT_1993726 [Mycena galopus ATCC 62051]|nr:hypothetical protein K438DRAFT_1993726 [Mycena galopus ATCC 62051]